jgi:endonuclease/exonuclease/phosphatase family metal-dependent hydrolase
MQEYRLAHHAFLAGALAGFEPAYPALTKDDSAVQLANMVFFSQNRFEKTGAGFFWYSDTPGAPLSQFAENTGHNRFVMWLRLRDRRGGREFLLCNTHFSAGGSERSRGLREKQAAMLAAFVEQQPADLPVIVTGDLNSTAATAPVKRLLASGLTDTFAVIHGEDAAGRTAHGFKGAKIPDKKGRKIDFILASSQFKATAAEIIRDTRDGRYPSDHYFVSAEVMFKQTAPLFSMSENNQ